MVIDMAQQVQTLLAGPDFVLRCFPEESRTAMALSGPML